MKFVLAALFCVTAVVGQTPKCQTFELIAIFDEEITRAQLLEYRSVLGAQIKQESWWCPDAVSPADARGLCQAIPGTVAWLGPKTDPPCFDPFNPRCCIKIQGVFMGRLLKKNKSSAATWLDTVKFALVGYNAGPTWVRREKRACEESRRRCNPRVWDGNVSNHCLRRDAACEESQNYIVRVLRYEPEYRFDVLPLSR